MDFARRFPRNVVLIGLAAALMSGCAAIQPQSTIVPSPPLPESIATLQASETPLPSATATQESLPVSEAPTGAPLVLENILPETTLVMGAGSSCAQAEFDP